MRVIDAHTGLDVHIGDRIALPPTGGTLVQTPAGPQRLITTPELSRERMRQGVTDDYYEVVAIHPGLFSATMDAWMKMGGKPAVLHRGLPLIVRWMHPHYRFQHVAFVPS